MGRSHWSEIHRVWALYAPPLRPDREVVAEMRRQIGAPAGRVLLLGVTPELANVAPELFAIDRNTAMVAHLWPGNTASRRVVVGDWLNGNFCAGSFATCIGDGSLNAVSFPGEFALLCGALEEVLREGGRIVFRVFLSPARSEDVETIRQSALHGEIGNFHAFKWRLAAAVAARAGRPDIPMGEVFDAFDGMFPDRDALAKATGWPQAEIETVTFLKGSRSISSFPTREQLLSAASTIFSRTRLVPAGGYELAERCPLLVAEKI